MLSTEAKARLVTIHLLHEEGFRQFPYDDATGLEVKAPVGNLTIGIGWNIQTNGCPLAIAQYAAMYYVNQFDSQLTKALSFYAGLDEVRKCILVDMAFNMGVPGLLTFTNTINLIEKGFYKNAADQMRKSKWYGQVKSRSEPMCIAMETGDWWKGAA